MSLPVVQCPYCGETVEVIVDPSGGHLQRYVEDCEVCCRPWQVTVTQTPEGDVFVQVERDD